MSLLMIPLLIGLVLLSISLYMQSTVTLRMLKIFDLADEFRQPRILKLSAIARALALVAMVLLCLVMPVTILFPG